MNAKELLAKLKAEFKAAFSDDSMAPSADAAAPATSDKVINSWSVDGGQPVYVDNSDDGIPDIDNGDAVYSDAAATSAYPDGVYKVSGTDFSFTVSGGIVTAVDDKDQKGPGDPMPADAGSADPAAPADMRKPDPAAPPAAPATAPAFNAEEKVAALESALAELKASVALAQEGAGKFAAQESKIAEQAKTIEKFGKTIEGIFELVGKLVELPANDPATLNDGNKQKFDKVNKKEQAIERIAAAMKELKKAGKA